MSQDDFDLTDTRTYPKGLFYDEPRNRYRIRVYHGAEKFLEYVSTKHPERVLPIYRLALEWKAAKVASTKTLQKHSKRSISAKNLLSQLAKKTKVVRLEDAAAELEESPQLELPFDDPE